AGDARPRPRGARAAEAFRAAERRPGAGQGQGRDVRRAADGVRGRVPRDHEEPEEDARALVQGPAGRQDTRRKRARTPSRIVERLIDEGGAVRSTAETDLPPAPPPRSHRTPRSAAGTPA